MTGTAFHFSFVLSSALGEYYQIFLLPFCIAWKLKSGIEESNSLQMRNENESNTSKEPDDFRA